MFLFRSVQELNLEDVFGIILNVSKNSKLCGWLQPISFASRHWVTIKKLQPTGDYYNLDSLLKKPHLIGKVSKNYLSFDSVGTPYVSLFKREID